MSDEAVELALAAAGELNDDLGFDVKKATEQQISGEGSEEQATRTFGIPEAMAIGSFLVTAAQFAWNIYKDEKDHVALIQQMVVGVETDKLKVGTLPEDKRLQLAASILHKLHPDAMSQASRQLGDVRQRSKKEWMREWPGLGLPDAATRKFSSATVLVPFADMDYFALARQISWSPPEGVAAGLPQKVTVPAGFVTDLASIPSYFWWVAPPAGRHGHAAILHDWLYWEKKAMGQDVERKIADQVFDVAMEELEVPLALRKSMWAAVRLYGGKYWDASAKAKANGEQHVVAKVPNDPTISWDEWKKHPGVFG